MRQIFIEQRDQGGKTKIVDYINENQYNIICDNEYNNISSLLIDLNNVAFKEGEIYFKFIDKDKIVLKRTDGAIINLVNIKHEVLLSVINEKIYKSYISFLENMNSEEYYCVYLTASKNGSNFSRIPVFSDFKTKETLLVELELNENEELTEMSKRMLEQFLSNELKKWYRVFTYGEENDVLRVCYDDKKLVVDPDLVKYVKPEVEKMYELYLEVLENYNKKRGI